MKKKEESQSSSRGMPPEIDLTKTESSNRHIQPAKHIQSAIAPQNVQIQPQLIQ
jgi:hypothetical protein